jgi:hypothetical protein
MPEVLSGKFSVVQPMGGQELDPAENEFQLVPSFIIVVDE